MQMTSASVGIGSVLLIRSLETSEEQKIKLVKSQVMESHQQNGFRGRQQRIEDDEETKNGCVAISDASPLGRALMGKERGEIVMVEAPAGIFSWKIVEIFD